VPSAVADHRHCIQFFSTSRHEEAPERNDQPIPRFDEKSSDFEPNQ
jgi:hypothetical protein